VGPLAVGVKDGDDLGRSALRTERVRHHRRELGRLAGLHPDGSLAEQDQDGPRQDGEPVTTGVHGELDQPLRRSNPNPPIADPAVPVGHD